MLDAGWIERYQTDDISRDKQSYRLTPDGRQRLTTDVDRLRTLTSAATIRLRTKEA